MGAQFKNLADPTENGFVKTLLDSAKRSLSKPVTKKEPVSSEMLDLCSKYIDCCDILVIRDLCMILLAFTAFLRYDELRN